MACGVIAIRTQSLNVTSTQYAPCTMRHIAFRFALDRS
jgi:hypothetical protein